MVHRHHASILHRYGDMAPRGHVTSSVTWSFDSRGSTSYGWSIVTMGLSCTVMEICPVRYWMHGRGHEKKDGRREREKGRERKREEKRKVEGEKEEKGEEEIEWKVKGKKREIETKREKRKEKRVRERGKERGKKRERNRGRKKRRGKRRERESSGSIFSQRTGFGFRSVL